MNQTAIGDGLAGISGLCITVSMGLEGKILAASVGLGIALLAGLRIGSRRPARG